MMKLQLLFVFEIACMGVFAVSLSPDALIGSSIYPLTKEPGVLCTTNEVSLSCLLPKSTDPLHPMLLPHSVLAERSSGKIYSVTFKPHKISARDALSYSNVVQRLQSGRGCVIEEKVVDTSEQKWVICGRLGTQYVHCDVDVYAFLTGEQIIVVSAMDLGQFGMVQDVTFNVSWVDEINRVANSLICQCARHCVRPIRPSRKIDRFMDEMKDSRYDWLFESIPRNRCLCDFNRTTSVLHTQNEAFRGVRLAFETHEEMNIAGFKNMVELARFRLLRIEHSQFPKDAQPYFVQLQRKIVMLQKCLIEADAKEIELVEKLKWPKGPWRFAAGCLRKCLTFDIAGYMDDLDEAERFDDKLKASRVEAFKSYVSQLELANRIWSEIVQLEDIIKKTL